MAKIVFGMNLSLDGYVDHEAFAPGPVLFRHWIEHVRGLTGSVYAAESKAEMKADAKSAAAEAKGGVKDEESAAIEKIRAALGATGTS